MLFYKTFFPLLDAVSIENRKKVEKSFDFKVLFHINLPTHLTKCLLLNISYTRRQVREIEPVIL